MKKKSMIIFINIPSSFLKPKEVIKESVKKAAEFIPKKKGKTNSDFINRRIKKKKWQG